MRRIHTEQLFEVIRTLNEAHAEVRQQLEHSGLQSADDLLIQCQEATINIGNMIESFEGEGFVTVTYLEEYCEMVFGIHDEIVQNGAVSMNPGKVEKKLNKALIKVENSIKNDVPLRKEVVFLPYKASMWDSLESVWKKANDDPMCDAYVVPIPYYDKNPDGSFREYHYEGDQYPKDVPVVHFDDYDLEQRHPDEIYIHNPYDEFNHVTSVHPHFYSSNIKNFTDKLVYIPYFVLSEVDPNNRAALEGMAHFATVPAVIHADSVIVQSEDMRQAYINVLSQALGEDTREVWEKKILGTGSPKFDKVQNTKKEDIEIPVEWLHIIQKPDGSRKKIVLYNNSLSALLQESERMIAKMKDVFGVFKEHRGEVALLWRPHPLIQATISSMRPDLWVEYEAIVNQYLEEGWGIYDDTADLDRAIVLSDAYYGDQSSVVQLCRKREMPIMIQNVDVLTYT